MCVLQAMSSLFYPTHYALPLEMARSFSSSCTRNAYAESPAASIRTHSLMVEETKDFLDYAFHQGITALDCPGTLGPFAAWAFHVMLQRLLEHTDRLDASHITTLLQLYARMGVRIDSEWSRVRLSVF